MKHLFSDKISRKKMMNLVENNGKTIIRFSYAAQKMVDLVTFTEEIFNGKLHFLCSVTFVLLLKDLLPQKRSSTFRNTTLVLVLNTWKYDGKTRLKI